MLSWLKTAFDNTKQVLGKVKSGVESGAKMFDKGKQAYGQIKSFASNVPMVGKVLSNLENQANMYAKKTTGLSLQDIDRGVSTAAKGAAQIPL